MPPFGGKAESGSESAGVTIIGGGERWESSSFSEPIIFGVSDESNFSKNRREETEIPMLMKLIRRS